MGSALKKIRTEAEKTPRCRFRSGAKNHRTKSVTGMDSNNPPKGGTRPLGRQRGGTKKSQGNAPGGNVAEIQLPGKT